jgi:hypothetical protein
MNLYTIRKGKYKTINKMHKTKIQYKLNLFEEEKILKSCLNYEKLWHYLN